MRSELIATANTNIRANGRAPWLLVWAVRIGLGTGVAASVFANAMHARPDVIARGIAAWAPLAFFLIVELLSRMPSERTFATFVRYAGAAVVGGVAAWVSYWHMVAVASKYGEQYPHLLPLSVDGLIVVTSMCLFELKRRGRVRAGTVAATLVAAESAAAGVPVEVESDRRQPGMYRAFGAEVGPPLYVGSTGNLAARITWHKSQSPWFPMVARWTFEPYDSIDSARLAEAAVVASERPIHNKLLQGPKVVGKRHRMPEGTVVSTEPPSVDMARVVSRPLPPSVPQRARKRPGGRPARADKAEHVAAVLSGEKSAAAVARELHLEPRTVQKWVEAARATDVELFSRPAPMMINGRKFSFGATDEEQGN